MARVQGCKTPTIAIVPPATRGSTARAWRAWAEARNRRVEQSGWWRRASARSEAGTVQVARQGGTGRSRAVCRGSHAGADPCWQVGPGRC